MFGTVSKHLKQFQVLRVFKSSKLMLLKVAESDNQRKLLKLFNDEDVRCVDRLETAS